MGELHLEVAAERLARGFGARFRTGKPRVAYRELLLSEASAVEAFDRDLGGERARATVALRIGPGLKGFVFEADPLDSRRSFLIRSGSEGAPRLRSA